MDKEQAPNLIKMIEDEVKGKSEVSIQDLREKLSIDESISDLLIEEIVKKVNPDIKVVDLYHWFDEPPTIKLEVKTSIIRSIIEEFMKIHKATSYYNLLKVKLGIKRRRAKLYIEWLKKDIIKPTVQSLLRFCKELNIDPRLLEKMNAFTRKFPVNLNSPTIIKLKTHILNEGTLLKEAGAHYIARYINKDPVLHLHVRKLLEELGVKIKEPPVWDRTRQSYVTSIDATTARILHKAGVPVGRRTMTNPTLDPRIAKNKELRKYHFKATLTEEGSSNIWITNDRRIRMSISWGRSIDITDKLTKEQAQRIRRLVQVIAPKKRRIAIGRLVEEGYRDIIETIWKLSPRMLRYEAAILKRLHRELDFISPRPSTIHVSKAGRITAHWVIRITNPDAVELLYREYGMLNGTWKNMRLKKHFELYSSYKNKILTDEDIAKIKEVAKSLSLQMYRIWTKKKFDELFGQTTSSTSI